MSFPSDLSVWLRVAGGLSAGIGSLLLAWRVRVLLKWIILALVTHEHTIQVMLDTLNNIPPRREGVVGAVNHLLVVEGKLGVKLLVLGFLLLGLGMLANAASHFAA